MFAIVLRWIYRQPDLGLIELLQLRKNVLEGAICVKKVVNYTFKGVKSFGPKY